MRRESQKSKIMKYLNEGNSITPLEALEMFGCFRLAAIIHSIKHQEKEFMEDKELITNMVTNKYGVKFGSYKIKFITKSKTNWIKNNQRVLGLVR
jgi:hypothetical protein|tara:strand:- start:90 stop:374 length:285 start_codon:yes stop_codon:yes gene_type:complete